MLMIDADQWVAMRNFWTMPLSRVHSSLEVVMPLMNLLLV